MQCSYYWALNPLPKRITDNESRTPSLEQRIHYQGKEYKIAILNDHQGRPELIRLVIPGLADQRIPEDVLPFIQSMREHMLTVLRLSYDPSVSLFDIHLCTFQADGSQPRVNAEMTWYYNPVFDATSIRNVFAVSLKHREELRLLSNGANEGIPVQYRFLSLYKLIEKKFRNKGKWKRDDLRKFVSRFEPDFWFKGISGDPVKAIHDCRDKCAHIRTGRNREMLGVSELNHKETLFVMKILPVMTKMAAEILKEKTEGKIVFQPIDREELWADQAISRIMKEHNISENEQKEFKSILADLKTAHLANRPTLIDRGNAWMVKNQDFLGEDAALIRKRLHLRN